MSKEQSNRLSAIRNGSQIIWTRGTGERFIVLEMTKIPGITEALECGGLAARAVVMGLTQTVGDAGAMNRTDKAGRIIPMDEFWFTKKNRMLARVTTLYRGEWDARPESAENAYLALALENLAARSAKAAEYHARFDTMEPAEKDALRKSPSIRTEIQRLKDADAPKGGDEMLDDLIAE